jgi:hypothetical protein
MVRAIPGQGFFKHNKAPVTSLPLNSSPFAKKIFIQDEFEKKFILDIIFSSRIAGQIPYIGLIGMSGRISEPGTEGVDLMQMPPVSVCHQ